MFTAANIRYEITDRHRGIAHGGIGVVHAAVAKFADTDAGPKLGSPIKHAQSVAAAVFSSDGQLLAPPKQDNPVMGDSHGKARSRRWNAKKLRLPATGRPPKNRSRLLGARSKSAHFLRKAHLLHGAVKSRIAAALEVRGAGRSDAAFHGTPKGGRWDSD
jgi:hypothetical protein